MANNQLCGLYADWYDADMKGIYTTEGITKLCEGLKGSAVTSLMCAAPQRVCFSVNAPGGFVTRTRVPADIAGLLPHEPLDTLALLPTSPHLW